MNFVRQVQCFYFFMIVSGHVKIQGIHLKTQISRSFRNWGSGHAEATFPQIRSASTLIIGDLE